MYSDKRKVFKLSRECWDCLEVLRDVGYAEAYVLFSSDHWKLIQEALRNHAPNIQDDWVRFSFEQKTVTFSLADGPMQSYQPRIKEFSSFGSAVRMLGAYETYVRTVIGISRKVMPQQIEGFKKKHKVGYRDFLKPELGRGTDFFREVFHYSPHSSYRPALDFLFQLRNVAVHNAGIADQVLVNATKNPYLHIVGGQLKVGDRISWNLALTLQLHSLLTSMLPELDPLVCAALNLPLLERQAYWYYQEE